MYYGCMFVFSFYFIFTSGVSESLVVHTNHTRIFSEYITRVNEITDSSAIEKNNFSSGLIDPQHIY